MYNTIQNHAKPTKRTLPNALEKPNNHQHRTTTMENWITPLKADENPMKKRTTSKTKKQNPNHLNMYQKIIEKHHKPQKRNNNNQNRYNAIKHAKTNEQTMEKTPGQQSKPLKNNQTLYKTI